MPKVSVVIPTYNRPELLARAIKSVLSQTYQDFEIIVVDDGQEKSAEDIVKQFNDERIKYIKHPVSKGGAAARNTGIKAGQGVYIALLDDDDEWLPEKLRKQVTAFDSCDDSVVLVFCGAKMFDKAGKLLRDCLPQQSGIIWPFQRVLHSAYIYTPTIMFRKKVALQGILFDEELKKNQEWDLELRLLKIGKFYAINEYLVRILVLDEEEHMGGQANIDNITSAYEKFIKKHYSDYKKNKKSLAFNYVRLGTLYRNNHRLVKAGKTIFKAWYTWPWNLKYLFYFFNIVLVIILGERIYSGLQKILKKTLAAN